MNAVERETVETRVLNPNASYKQKQCSYRKTNLKKKFWRQIVWRRNVQRPNGGTETYPTPKLDIIGNLCFLLPYIKSHKVCHGEYHN